jgi:hypothetical protein
VTTDRFSISCISEGKGLFLIAVFVLFSHESRAETTILQNKLERPVQIRFQSNPEGAKKFTLAPKGSVPLSVTGSIKLWYSDSNGGGSGTIWPNTIYRISERTSGSQQRSVLQRIPISGPKTTPPQYPRGKIVERKPWPLRIKIAVDDDVRTRQSTWEKKIRERMTAASRLLEYFCGIKLEVVEITRWESKDTVRDFNLSLSEFSAKVPVHPAQLVIGFTSQYNVNVGRQRLGGTRGPLRSHILIREHGPKIGESERLEVLLHELGHYLGAAHSASQSSLMRPVLGDGQSNARSFQLTFDPINLLVMNLVSNQIRSPEFHSVKQIPISVQQHLLDAYNWLAEQQPGDKSAINMAQILCGGVLRKIEGPVRAERRKGPSVEELRARLAFRRSVQVIFDSLGRVASDRDTQSLSLDKLTEAYIRVAAKAAATLEEKHALKSFYFALAIALDRGYLIKRYDAVAKRIRTETDLVADASREKFVGKATIWRRVSLLQDFISAGVLTQFVGVDSARDITTLEEIKQAAEPAGFSFAAIVASRSGIRLQQALATGDITFTELAATFTVERFVPSVAADRKIWTSAELEADYGGTDGIYFQREIDKIQKAVDGLPPYMK